MDPLPFQFKRLDALGIELLFARAKMQIMDILKRTKFVENHGKEKFFRIRTHAFNYAWEKLGHNHKDTCPLHIAKPLSDIEAEEVAAAEEEAASTISADSAEEDDTTTEKT